MSHRELNHSIVPGRGRGLTRLMRIVGVVACMIISGAALAVTAPYSDNFDSYANGSTPANFLTETSGGGYVHQSQWSIANPSGTAGVYNNSVTADFMRTSAAVNVTNLAHSDFLVSTSFVINSYGYAVNQSSADTSVALGALSSSPDLSTGYLLSYEVLDYNGNSSSANGALQILNNGQVVAGFPIVSLPVVTGMTYTMTLLGTYSANGLLLTGTLTEGGSSISVSETDLNPQQGSYFGYSDHVSGMTNHAAWLDVDYDNFSVSSVPEPGIGGYLGLGIAVMGFYGIARVLRHCPVPF